MEQSGPWRVICNHRVNLDTLLASEYKGDSGELGGIEWSGVTSSLLLIPRGFRSAERLQRRKGEQADRSGNPDSRRTNCFPTAADDCSRIPVFLEDGFPRSDAMAARARVYCLSVERG